MSQFSHRRDKTDKGLPPGDAGDQPPLRPKPKIRPFPAPLYVFDEPQDVLPGNQSVHIRDIVSLEAETVPGLPDNPVDRDLAGFRMEKGHDLSRPGLLPGEGVNRYDIAVPYKGRHAEPLSPEAEWNTPFQDRPEENEDGLRRKGDFLPFPDLENGPILERPQ